MAEKKSLALALDLSFSMSREKDGKNGMSRFEALKMDTLALLESMAFLYEAREYDGELGIVTFNSTAKTLHEMQPVDQQYLQNTYKIIGDKKKFYAHSRTNTIGAVKLAKSMMEGKTVGSPIVMITDGVYNEPHGETGNPYHEHRNCPPIHLALQGKWTEKENEKIVQMKRLAEDTGGKFYHVPNPKDVGNIYRRTVWEGAKLASLLSFEDLTLISSKETHCDSPGPMGDEFFIEITPLKEDLKLIESGTPKGKQILVKVLDQDGKPAKDATTHTFGNGLFFDIKPAKKQNYRVSLQAGTLSSKATEKDHAHCLVCFAKHTS